jgi:uncharacterized protein
MPDEFRIRASAEGVELPLHVQPRAKRNEISGRHNGTLKLRLTAPPVDDAANRSVLEFFARLLGVPKSSIQIVSGLRSRDKTIFIRGVSLDKIRRALEEEI